MIICVSAYLVIKESALPVNKEEGFMPERSFLDYIIALGMSNVNGKVKKLF